MEINSLYTALSGIQTTQQLLNTTTRNITNAQTPGYVRKDQQAVSNAFTGGVLSGPIRRFIDASLLQKLRTNNADSSFNSVRQDALTKLDQLSGDPQNGTSISAKINTLGAAFQNLTANPQDGASAEAVLDAAHDLAQSFNEQNDAMLSLQRDTNSAIVDGVASVNKDLQLIASLNQKVVGASANGQDPTDLMDQRDNAINDLSKLITVNAFTDNQGVVQVLSGDYHPLAGLYAEVVTYNQVNHAVSISGKQMTTIGGSVGGNLQVMDGDVRQRLQNLSEVANNLTSVFQGLPTSTVSLNGTLTSPAPAAGGADVAVPGVTKLTTDNGNQYSANLAYRSTGNGSVYQLVVSSMVPVEGAPAVTTNGYTAATGTGGYVIGTVDVSTTPPTFAGVPAQLSPTTANAQPGVVRLLTAFTAGLSAGASAPTSVTANGATTLFTQSSGSVPKTTLALTGAQLPATGVQQFQDSAASGGFTITTDNGNQYTATVAFRPKTPGASGSGYDVVVTSMTPIGSAPGVANLNYTAGVAATSAGTGGLVIGTYDSSTNPPTFFSTGAMTDIPPSSTLPSKFPGHIEPITAITGVTTGAITIGGPVTATNNITSPYYAGNIQLSPNITARALQVGDIYAGTTQDNNAGAAQSAALALNNQVMQFSTSGITGPQTLQDGASAMTVGIGQDLSNTDNKITELTTAATQIQQAIAPDSEVNLDTEMSKLVVLQNAYQANARVVATVSQMLDTLISLPT